MAVHEYNANAGSMSGLTGMLVYASGVNVAVLALAVE
jgi:hypothetical protein